MSGGLEVQLAAPQTRDDPAFLFDFTSADAYLAAERILALMPVPVEWVPVDGARLVPEAAPGSEAVAQRGDGAPLGAGARAELETRAAARGVQRFVWPEPHPFDSGLVLRAATYAKGIGRAVAFSLAAFRQCYAAGRSLEELDNVLIAASACEMHPAAVVKGTELRTTKAALDAATQRAAAQGVHKLPAVWVPGAGDTPGEVFHGDAALEDAALALTRRAA